MVKEEEEEVEVKEQKEEEVMEKEEKRRGKGGIAITKPNGASSVYSQRIRFGSPGLALLFLPFSPSLLILILFMLLVISR